MQALAKELGDRPHRAAVREAGARRLSQLRGDHRRRRVAARRVSQDAHPRRSALQREVLLHAGRRDADDARSRASAAGERVSRVEDALREHRRVDLLGSVVSPRPRASPSLLGADILFYPTAIGWHPAEKAEFGQAQVDAWRTMQRAHAIANGVFVASPNRVGHEDEPGTNGTRVLRPLVHRRPVRPPPRRGGHGAGDARRDVRSAPHRGDAAQLAVPARPPDRRLRADPEPLPRRRERRPRRFANDGIVSRRNSSRTTATWIAWPHHEPDWPGKLEPIPWVYAEIVRVLARHERVEILCHDETRSRGRAPCASTAHGVARQLSAARRCRPTASGCATRRRPALSTTTGSVRARELALQRLGEVRELRARRAGRRGGRAHHGLVARSSRSARTPASASSSRAAPSTPTAPARCS